MKAWMKKMNEWVNERKNERTNERKKRTNERTNELANENEWTDRRTIERMNDQIYIPPVKSEGKVLGCILRGRSRFVRSALRVR